MPIRRQTIHLTMENLQEDMRRAREMISERTERQDEQTNDNRVGDRGWHSSTCGPLSSPTDLDVEQLNGANGSDTLPVPERDGDAAMGVPVGEPDIRDGSRAERSRLGLGDIPDGGTYRMLPDGRVEYSWDTRPDWRELYESLGRRVDMPWSINPTTFEHTFTEPVHARTERPAHHPNELILSEDPVEQYHLTAISFFKGIQAPEGGTSRYYRTYQSLKDNIIEALQNELNKYRTQTRGRVGLDEAPERDLPARGRTR